MPHIVSWYIPNRVVYLQVSGDLTLEDIEAASNDIIHLMDQGEAPVHVMANDEAVEKMPMNLREIHTRFAFLRHPAFGWAIGIGETNPLLNFIVPMVMKMVRVNYVRRHTLEEARAFLEKSDLTLDWTSVQDIPQR